MTAQTPSSREQLGRLLRAARPGWRLIRTWELSGSTAAQVSAIEAEEPDGRRRTLVLHQYGAANLLADPHVASHEYRLLELLVTAGLPVPTPYLADESCSIVTSPCLLQEYLDGERVDQPLNLAAFTAELAAILARLHGARINRADVPFLADVRDDTTRMMRTRPAHPGTFSWAAAVLDALAAAWPPRQLNPPAVLHGDYWPGNVLWRDGRVAGVVDWEDAQFGDPLADLAVTRLEIGGLYGESAMNNLTASTWPGDPNSMYRHCRCGTSAPPCAPAASRSRTGGCRLNGSQRYGPPTTSSPRPHSARSGGQTASADAERAAHSAAEARPW